MNNISIRNPLYAIALMMFGAGHALADEAAIQQCMNTHPGWTREQCGGGSTSGTSSSSSGGPSSSSGGSSSSSSGGSSSSSSGGSSSSSSSGCSSSGGSSSGANSNSPTGSDIDNFTFNHLHDATDYTTYEAVAGCSSCAGSKDLPKLLACQLLQIRRYQSLRDVTWYSSFGIGNFMTYDATLTLFEVNGVTYVDCFDIQAWSAPHRLSPSGLTFKDTIYNGIKSFTLYDAAGKPTVTKSAAVSAILVLNNGFQRHFDIFELDANTKGGRLAKTADPAGVDIIRFEYPVAKDAVVSDTRSKWRLGTATDFMDNRMTFEWSTLDCGATVISRIGIPGDKSMGYEYDAAGNLAAVTYPNGDRSTFVREVTATGMKITFAEAGAQGMHRNKSALYTNNIAANLLTASDRPQIYNQSSWLVRKIFNGENEMTYWGTNGGNGTGGTMHRRIYEGGGRLKFIDTAEKSSYTKWSLPKGVNPADPFGSFAVSKEKYGFWSPYWQYAENRSGRPVQVTTPDSPVHYYLYDGAGNRRLERIGTKVARSRYDARFNKPTLLVDFSGRAQLMEYDASGNLVSRKSGWLLDNSQGAGIALPGLKCEYFENVSTIDALATASAVSVQQADTFALGQRETLSTQWGMRFTGKLQVESDGIRTFYLSADDRARLYVDGVLVTDVAYNQGTKSAAVNLTAGAHDILVEFVEIGGGQRLDLTWSGPETKDASGVAQKTIIGSNFLTHDSTADELTLRPGAGAFAETWEYLPGGLQKAYVDPTGRRTEYEYDANHRIAAVKETGDTGEAVVTQRRTYDARGNVATQTDALGRTVSYAYDDRNRLVKTTYGDGTTETSRYGTDRDANLVIESKNRAGSVTKYEYDSSGRRTRSLQGYAWANTDGTITEVLPKPGVSEYAYLDGTTDISRVTNDGRVREYDYDYKGRIVAERSFPRQGKVLASSTAYNTDEVLFSRTDTHGCRSFYAYRRPDMVVVREVRELVPGTLGTLSTEQQVLALTRDLGANPGYTVVDYSKDLDGRTLITFDAMGIKTLTILDSASRVTAVTKAADLPEEVTDRVVYDAAGRVTSRTDALGRATRWEYTPAGRVKAIVHPDSTREEFTYFDDGKLASRKDADGFTSKQYWSACCGRSLGSANALGEGTLNFSDGLGRVTYSVQVKDVEAAKAAITSADGITLPSDAVLSASTVKYDARGRLVATTKWLVVPAGVDPKNAPIATDTTQGLTTTYAYFDDLSDARFAPVLAELAKQSIVLTSGSATVVTNPAGKSSFTVTDGAGRTVASGVFNK